MWNRFQVWFWESLDNASVITADICTRVLMVHILSGHFKIKSPYLSVSDSGLAKGKGHAGGEVEG